MDPVPLWKRIYRAYEPFRKTFLWYSLLCIVISAFTALKPYFLSMLIERLSKAPKVATALLPIACLVAVQFIQTVLQWIKMSIENICLDVKPLIHLALKNLKKILSLAICQHRSQHSGITQKVVNQGRQSTDQIVRLFAYNAAPLALQIVFNTAAVMMLAPKIGVVLLAAVLVFLAWTYLGNKVFMKCFIELDKKDERVSKHYTEIIRNLALVQIFAEEKRMYDEYERDVKKYAEENISVWQRYERWMHGRFLLTGLVECLILFLAVREMEAGAMSLGTFSALATWSAIAISDLWQAGWIYRNYINHSVYANKYFAIEDIEPLVKVSENPIFPEVFRGKISLKGVSYHHQSCKYIPTDDEDEGKEKAGILAETDEDDKRPLALANVSLTIEAGETVAIIGPTGAGKSSLIALLLRAADPTSGSIEIDGIDLRELDLVKYRQKVGVIEQDIRLFSRTIKYNMTFGRNGTSMLADEAELDRLAEASDIISFKARLNKGYETRVGENGVELSGGQRQKVGIARAIGKGPRILICDEATSSLDADSEDKITESIERVSEGLTTLIIAHRYSTWRRAKRIIVMDEGKIVGNGSHDFLMNSCPKYQSLVRKQMQS